MKSLSEKKNFLPGLLSINHKKVNNLQREDILELLSSDLYDLLDIANRIREKYCGNKIKFCSIVNAKSGRCSDGNQCTYISCKIIRTLDHTTES